LPVAFEGFVYFDFDPSCQITHTRAFANIPTEVLGQVVNLPGVPFRKILGNVLGLGSLFDHIFDKGILS
jgi:hypothetical protein